MLTMMQTDKSEAARLLYLWDLREEVVPGTCSELMP
jgi:hypothetical protein